MSNTKTKTVGDKTFSSGDKVSIMVGEKRFTGTLLKESWMWFFEFQDGSGSFRIKSSDEWNKLKKQ